MKRHLKEVLKSVVQRVAWTSGLQQQLDSMGEANFYYCANLAGECSYSTCINCDLTISCNCSDSDGAGQIGDLNKDTFASIWKSPDKAAHRFRRELSMGKLPIPTCSDCYALRKVDQRIAQEKLFKSDYPTGFMIENGIACNYHCTVCPRHKLPAIRKRNKMTIGDLEKVAILCRELGMEYLFYYNLNEPFCSATILEEIQLLKLHNPNSQIFISTNGSLINTDNARTAALLLEELICSIDGASESTASIYQVNIRFDRVIENLRLLVEAKKRCHSKTTITWKYVVFPWNDKETEINTAIHLAERIGCNRIIFNVGNTGDGKTSNFPEQSFFKKLPTTRMGEYYVITFPLLSASNFTYIDMVQKIFIGYYQRPAGPDGLIYWAGRLHASGGNLADIIETFTKSPESQRLYGTINSSNISRVVRSIFWALFNHAPGQAGLNYYVTGFNSGRFTAATIMLDVLYGAQNEDLQLVNNKITASNLFTRTIDPDLDGKNFQATYLGDADAQKARNWLSKVGWDPATIPTQAQVTLFIKNHIADPGDSILNR